ncbi:uncharacterized protein SCHCODRAFT_02639377 [Schizophyllum commune H4-8]|uniref:uncharacterized protein n=1 Tax=Schizophyllum commune (strain H4-8 / FGSC 9210) TaxID=578458 RepID=UPI00215EB52F|nr:uncharacterized protein SCHCODRAFT_02639377 [Schizophyllum commune H4-8]KAI5887968.1 hypothetical protein SCHCODRAFT_02639377 [Schizophyllum commune H4-8]
MPQKGLYRAMACFQCSCLRIHCSHVPASRNGNPALMPAIDLSWLPRPVPAGNWRPTHRSDAGPPKSVSSGPWLSSPGATRKIKINGKRVEIAK